MTSIREEALQNREEALKFLRDNHYLSADDDGRDFEDEGLVRAAQAFKENPNDIFFRLYLAMRGGRPSF